MTTSRPREIPFTGVRIRFDSEKRFDEVVFALLADVGEKPLMIDDIPAKFESWESYKAEVESHVGPSGFILFAIMDHGAWIKKVHIRKKSTADRDREPAAGHQLTVRFGPRTVAEEIDPGLRGCKRIEHRTRAFGQGAEQCLFQI